MHKALGGLAGEVLALGGSPGGHRLQELASEIPTSAGSYVESLSPLPESDQRSPILVVKKLELREGKFHPRGTASHHLQCTCTYQLPPSSRALWRHIGTDHKNAGVVSLPPISRAEGTFWKVFQD